MMLKNLGIFDMKILVVMKRFGSNKDMVLQNFGRQRRLFQPLARKHKIDFLCPDYVKKESKFFKSNGLRFIVKRAGFFSAIWLLKSLDDLIKKEMYDIIVASTDPLIGAVCYRFSKKHKIPIVEDACPALGSVYHGKKPGSFGEFGAFSFQGAKITVTGIGGMLVTSNADLFEKVKYLLCRRLVSITSFLGIKIITNSLSSSLAFLKLNQ